MVSLYRTHRSDCVDLAQAKLESCAHYEPWTRPFTTLDGFDEWISNQLGVDYNAHKIESILRYVATPLGLRSLNRPMAAPD